MTAALAPLPSLAAADVADYTRAMVITERMAGRVELATLPELGRDILTRAVRVLDRAPEGEARDVFVNAGHAAFDALAAAAASPLVEHAAIHIAVAALPGEWMDAVRRIYG